MNAAEIVKKVRESDISPQRKAEIEVLLHGGRFDAATKEAVRDIVRADINEKISGIDLSDDEAAIAAAEAEFSASVAEIKKELGEDLELVEKGIKDLNRLTASL